MARGRLLTFLLGAVAAAAGLAAGAATQGEELLRGVGDSGLAQLDASGSLIVLTALLCAVGVGLCGASLVPGTLRPHVRDLGVLVAATWLLVVLLQTDLPNYTAFAEAKQASLSQTNLVREAPGSPSVLVPVFAVGVGLVLAIAAVMRRLVDPASAARSADATRLLNRHRAQIALAIPFLVMLAIGHVRVLVAVPGEDASHALAVLLLPVAALAALALAGLLVWRQEILFRWSRTVHMAPVAREAWRATARVQTILLSVLLATAILSTFLPTRDLEATSLGRSLVLTLRSHGQAAAFVLIPMIGLLRTQRAMLDVIREDARPHGVANPLDLYVVLGVATLAAAAATLFTGQALLPWIIMAALAGAWAGIRLGAVQAVPHMLLAAWALWGRGNTIIGAYDGTVFPPLDLITSPGLSALWRLLAVTFFGWTLFRLGRSAGAREPVSVAMPLSLAVAVGAGLIALIELPLAAWIVAGGGDDTVAVGSLIASQSPAVRGVAHAFVALAGLGSGVALARLVRPFWFRPGHRKPDAATLPIGSGSASTKPGPVMP